MKLCQGISQDIRKMLGRGIGSPWGWSQAQAFQSTRSVCKMLAGALCDAWAVLCRARS